MRRIYIKSTCISISCHSEINHQRGNMNNISIVKPHVCHKCDKRFGRRDNLRRHAENVHALDESEMDEVDDDREISAIRSEKFGVDNYEPEFKKRRFQDSETESCESESPQSDDEESQENDSESETEKENDDLSDEDESSPEMEDNAAYRDWLEEAKEATEETWSENYEKYLTGDMDEGQ